MLECETVGENSQHGCSVRKVEMEKHAQAESGYNYRAVKSQKNPTKINQKMFPVI